MEESLDELGELTLSAGAEIVDRVLQTRPAPDPATLIGSGKVEEIAATVKSSAASLVIFDQELSPSQQRNLEKALDTRVIGRTDLILDIFATRARTREGRLQVELAQLSYLLPRLTGRGVEMSRLGGGIGTRGPGETRLETDRRRIARRIRKLEQDLSAVRTGRAVHRQKRHSVPLPTAALVGYTNAGKSTLFNRLTSAGVLADARMFATLDPTVRSLQLPSRRKILLSDTVGFIRNLPTTLVKAFRATLEEVHEASLVLHVVDVSSPHAATQTAHVLKVLAEIDASAIPQLLVLNKVDRLTDRQADAETMRHRLLGEADHAIAGRAVLVSGLTGEGVPELLDAIDRHVEMDPIRRVALRIPQADTAALAGLHRMGRVLETRYAEDYCYAVAEVPESVGKRFKSYIYNEG